MESTGEKKLNRRQEGYLLLGTEVMEKEEKYL